jgi:hypothetical protein
MPELRAALPTLKEIFTLRTYVYAPLFMTVRPSDMKDSHEIVQ